MASVGKRSAVVVGVSLREAEPRIEPARRRVVALDLKVEALDALEGGPVGERGIVRGLFLDLHNFELDVSADAAFPVESSDNRAREGMPNLDTLFEIGPKLIYKFLPRGSGHELDLSLAARAVLSTDIVNWRYQGVVINPGLTWRDARFLDGDLSLVAGINPLFGFDGLNRYFYQVSLGDARSDRPTYNADAGYIGTELTLGAS